jgi:hypothetical protein
MAYVKKADQEKQFVQMILDKGGIKAHMVMYERGHLYYAMELNNGEGRYWTDFSDESLELLGLKNPLSAKSEVA